MHWINGSLFHHLESTEQCCQCEFTYPVCIYIHTSAVLLRRSCPSTGKLWQRTDGRQQQSGSSCSETFVLFSSIFVDFKHRKDTCNAVAWTARSTDGQLTRTELWIVNCSLAFAVPSPASLTQGRYHSHICPSPSRCAYL